MLPLVPKDSLRFLMAYRIICRVVKHSRAGFLERRNLKHMVHMLFVRWLVYAYWDRHNRCYESKIDNRSVMIWPWLNGTSRYLDLPLLISWLSSRQYAPEGGLSGRTNKLVDGCYSHWVGGCWPFVEAALDQPGCLYSESSPIDGTLYNQEGLARYVLSCCQAELGGLRDKPSA